MGVSQPLNFKDKLVEALAGAQQALDQYKLTAKVGVVMEDVPGAAGVEPSMDRTAKAAKDAAEKTLGPSSSGLGGPDDKLVDAMSKLIRVMEKATGEGGGLSTRRRGRLSAPGGGEDEAGEPGWVNPYMLQGLLQNPMGTAKNSVLSMLMGGAGMGMKAPSGLMEMLAGSSGTFRPGLALGAETGMLGAGEAGAFANPALIGAAKVAVPVAAFAGTMAYLNTHAKERFQDSMDYVSDQRFGQGIGVNWRQAMWENGGGLSRTDIWGKDIQAMAGAAGIGFGGLTRNGQYDFGTALNPAAEEARRMGIGPEQMGSLLGAGVRSGTFSLQGADGVAQMNRYLAGIENWTAKTAEFGFSSNEALGRLAQVSQRGLMGTNILTDPARASLLSMEQKIMGRLPPELQREGAKAISEELGSHVKGDTERVLLMNQVLGADGRLTKAGRDLALEAFGSHQVATAQKRWGSMADTWLAHGLTNSDLGLKKLTAMYYQGAEKGGYLQQAMFMRGGGNAITTAEAADAALQPDFLTNMREDKTVKQYGVHTPAADRLRATEESLAQLGQTVARLSMLEASYAENVMRVSQESDRLSKSVALTGDAIDHANDRINGLARSGFSRGSASGH